MICMLSVGAPGRTAEATREMSPSAAVDGVIVMDRALMYPRPCPFERMSMPFVFS